MTIKTFSTTALFLFASILPAPQSLPAQEVIDLTGRDQRLDANFEETFRIGVLEGEDWEMFGSVMRVAFDENGNLYIVDAGGGMSLADGTRIMGLGSAETRVLVSTPPATSCANSAPPVKGPASSTCRRGSRSCWTAPQL